MDIISQLYLKIALNTLKDVKDVRNLATFKEHPHRLEIPSSNLGRFGAGLLISTDRFIRRQAKGISSF